MEGKYLVLSKAELKLLLKEITAHKNKCPLSKEHVRIQLVHNSKYENDNYYTSLRKNNGYYEVF